jgi:serine/threonine-protein kinase
MPKYELDADTWLQVHRLLDEALDQPADARERWLGTLGPQFDRLREPLRDLLSRAARVETGDFLGTLPKLAANAAEADAPNERLGHEGEAVGPYRLLREIGHGGMGTVWLAERIDGLINRPVALKLPHSAWRRAGLAERMGREREILATLDHRNIARLLDAGLTTKGQPFLALEFVEGRPIDQYCVDTGEGVAATLEQRLKIFLQVANAVAYAHGKLVIHRDLKPANILVAANGGVRLLDFGIAKLLADGEAKETRLTELSGRALTPDYASPEQILGEPLTVASDVYSLGVILYELLAGARPYRLKRDSRGALEEAILQTDPVRPSDAAPAASRKRLRGDLDTIALKALKKNPAERYATVNAFVDDIARYLDDLPVLAQPDSRSYRAMKFFRRNRVVVGTVTVVLVAIVVGAGIAVWQMVEAGAQRDLAQRQRQRAEQVKDLMADIFRDADPGASDGKPISAADLLRQAVERVEAAAIDDPSVRAELLRILGWSLLSFYDIDSAERVANGLVAQTQRDFPPGHIDILRARLLNTEVLRYRGNLAGWRAELAQVMPAMEKLQAQMPVEYFDAVQSAAHVEVDAYRYEAAHEWSQRALVVARISFGERSDEYITALSLISLTHRYLRQIEPSLTFARQSLDLALQLHGGEQRHPLIIDARASLANALKADGQLQEALSLYQSVVADSMEVWGADSPNVGFHLEFLADVQRPLGYLDEALESASRALTIAKRHGASPDSAIYISREIALTNALLALRKYREARSIAVEVAAKNGKLHGERSVRARNSRARAALATALMGDLKLAKTMMAAELSDLGPADAAKVPRVLFVVGLIARRTGDPGAAIDFLSRALEADVELLRVADRVEPLLELGLAYLDLADIEHAAVKLRQALQLLDSMGRRWSPLRADVMAGLSKLSLREGNAVEALDRARQVSAFWNGFAPASVDAHTAEQWLREVSNPKSMDDNAAN